MADLISLDELEDYMTDLLEKEVRNAEESLEEILASHAAHLRGKLEDVSPKDTGAYKSGWRVKTAWRNHEKVSVVYNVAKPWIMFALEYGEKGHGGRPHIRKALVQEIDELMTELTGSR